MKKFRIQDLKSLENAPSSPASLCNGVGDMILNSTVARAKIESVNPSTGEYRLVLEGTLEREESRFGED